MRTSESAGVPPRAGKDSARVSLDLLIVLIAKRLALGADAAATKFIDGGQIDDPAREKEILDCVASVPGSIGGGAAGVAFFRDQIMANKIIQRGFEQHWREKPADFPVRWHHPTEEIRPKFDVINRPMLLLLPFVPRLSVEDLAEVEDRVDLKLGTVEALRPLGEVRRAAARIATRSLGPAD